MGGFFQLRKKEGTVGSGFEVWFGRESYSAVNLRGLKGFIRALGVDRRLRSLVVVHWSRDVGDDVAPRRIRSSG